MRDWRAGVVKFKNQPIWVVYQYLFYLPSCHSWMNHFGERNIFTHNFWAAIFNLVFGSLALFLFSFGLLSLLSGKGTLGELVPSLLSYPLFGLMHFLLVGNMTKKYPN